MASVKGLDDALSALDKVLTEEMMRRAVAAGARVFADEIKLNAPEADAPYEAGGHIVEPGNIARNTVVRQAKDRIEAAAVIRSGAKNGDAARIAGFKEFGTVKETPEPFIRPAFDSKKSEAVRALEGSLKKDLAK